MRDSGDTVSVQGRGTVAGALVRHLAGRSVEYGVERERLVSESGVAADILDGTVERTPVEFLEALVQAAVGISADPLLGLHLSERTSQEGFGVLGYIRQTCNSLRDVIDVTVRYESLVSDVGRTSLGFEPGTAVWSWRIVTDNPGFRFQAVDYLLGCWRHTLLRLLQAPGDVLLGVDLEHERPPEPLAGEYERVFGCPVRFGLARSALLLPMEVLDWPLAGREPGLRNTLEQHAQALMQNEPSNSFEQQVRAVLEVLLRGRQASRERLASELGISTRHLSRRMKAAGTSYRQLSNELRLELACQYLRDPAHTVQEVGERLGFTESRSFIRWFRGRAGVTPGQYRRGRAENKKKN